MISALPSSRIRTPPRAEKVRRALRGPWRYAVLASTSASRAVRPTAVAASRPVQAGRGGGGARGGGGGGVEEVVGGLVGRRVEPDAAVDARGRHAAGAEAEGVDGAAGERVEDFDVV